MITTKIAMMEYDCDDDDPCYEGGNGDGGDDDFVILVLVDGKQREAETMLIHQRHVVRTSICNDGVDDILAISGSYSPIATSQTRGRSISLAVHNMS